MTHGGYLYFALPSKLVTEHPLHFIGHMLRRPASRLVQRVTRSLSGSRWKKPRGQKQKFCAEVVKKDLRTLGADGQFRRDVRFRRLWNSNEWIDSVQLLAEDREAWTELSSKTADHSEDAGN
ncbi:hypothetical protein RB195_017747 [Necator americanus]|uniref:Uncharacterized protein n=1 Tax=Necator americanus TaxID=51031 RepID=A0ABR1CA85_NECAM